MFDPRVSSCGYRGFGSVCDAKACFLDHIEIVGPISDGQCFIRVKRELFPQFNEGRALGLLAEDWFGDFAREFTFVDHQRIGTVLIEADHRANSMGEQRKAARDEGGINAMTAQSRN